MKNVLIYMNQNLLTPTGGPSGYNFVLKQELDKTGDKHIHFLDLPVSALNKYNHVGRELKGTWFGDFLKLFKDFYKYFKILYIKQKPPIDLTQYDAVHFHTSIAMYQVRESLKDYKGKVIFTSHAPSVLYKELISALTEWEQKHMNWFYGSLEHCDEYAFNRADYIIFPCEGAEEPYSHTWDKYDEIKTRRASSFRYLLTGTNKRTAKMSREEVCKKFKIPNDAFIISYAGRHNKLKGYDLLKDIGEKVLSENPNAYFLVAGVEDPIKGIDHERWIEVGWTNDPHSLIAASDVFVLPNRETYFDLIMLEVLSLGTIVVASNTGGNKHFKNNKGVLLYDDINNAIQRLNEVYCMDKDSRRQIGLENENLFDNFYSSETFATNYVNLIKSLH